MFTWISNTYHLIFALPGLIWRPTKKFLGIEPKSQGSAASIERRAAPRIPYPGVRLAACCDENVTSADGLDFRLVVCFDVSSSGISFLMPDPPAFHHAVVKLGGASDSDPVVIEVARCDPYNWGFAFCQVKPKSARTLWVLGEVPLTWFMAHSKVVLKVS
jgi:hypothetical protein